MVILVLGGLAMWATGGSPAEALRRVSAVLLGRHALIQSAVIDAGIALSALIVHIALFIVMGLVLATIMAPFSLDSSAGMASVVGILFGVAMYWFNFHAMIHAFPWFANARGWLALAFNIVFGLAAAETYRTIERRGADSSKG